VLAVLSVCACTAAACSRGEAPRAVATPVATLTPNAAASPQTSGRPAPVATVAGSPTGAAAADDDFEWNLAEEASGTDFEIDADATSYFMPLLNTVTFKAKALNGTPPFTFTWNFGDGSPEGSGALVKHTYTTLGTFDARATGSDASGSTSVVTLRLLVTTPEGFAAQLGLDPKLLETLPSPSPSPAVTP